MSSKKNNYLKNKVVIGTWPLSGDYGHVPLPTIQEILLYCYSKGLKEFDTAPNYGNGFMEFCLGKIFYDKMDVKINTKVGNRPFLDKNFTISALKDSFAQSLKRLCRKNVNVLFLHNPRNEITNYEEILVFMNQLKREKKITEIGLSKAKGFEYDIDLNIFDVIQDDVNLLYLEPLANSISNDITFMARSPLASGLLSGKLSFNTKFSPDDHRSKWLIGPRLESISKRIAILKKISKLNLPELAMRFLLHNPKIDKIIFGIKSIEHVDEIIKNIQKPPLEDDFNEKLIKLYEDDFGLENEKELGY